MVIPFSRLFLTIMVSLCKMVLASLGERLQKWEGCLHSSRPQESGDKTSKLAKLPQLAKLAKLLLKLMLWLLLLCFFLLRLLVLLRRRDVSQKLSELLSLHGTQERSQVGEDARKPVCLSRVLVSRVVGIGGRCW